MKGTIMSNLFIYGITNYSRLLYYYEKELLQKEVSGFVVNKQFLPTENDLNYKIYAYEDLTPSLDKEIIIGIGYNKMNTIREQIYSQLKKDGYKIGSFIHPTANIAPNVEIGEGCIIMENVVIQPYVKIGKCNIFWSTSHIAHDAVIGDFNFFGVMSAISGNVRIKDHCFFGTNCSVGDGIVVNPFSLIGAGTTITKSTNRNNVYNSQRGQIVNSDSKEFFSL